MSPGLAAAILAVLGAMAAAVLLAKPAKSPEGPPEAVYDEHGRQRPK